MKFQKLLCILALLIAVSALIAGCMQGGNVGVQPEPTADFMPQGNANAPEGKNTAADAAANRFDWTQNAAQIEGRINRISEIDQSRVVVADDTALVGVKFDSAYRGEMTERIREMVAAEIMAVDPSVTTVAVTAYEEDVNAVYDLADRVLAGRSVDELKQEINEIVRNATTLR